MHHPCDRSLHALGALKIAQRVQRLSSSTQLCCRSPRARVHSLPHTRKRLEHPHRSSHFLVLSHDSDVEEIYTDQNPAVFEFNFLDRRTQIGRAKHNSTHPRYGDGSIANLFFGRRFPSSVWVHRRVAERNSSLTPC